MHTHRTFATIEAVQARVRELEAVLTARGLTVHTHADERGAFVVVRNDASAADDPVGQRINRGLTQTVVLSKRGTGELAWFWQWSGATRDAPPEYEYLCPADAIAEAGDRIAKVLGLRSI